MSEKKKMGRPIVGEPKDIRMTIRVDETTYRKICQKSKELGISQSEYIRNLVNQN